MWYEIIEKLTKQIKSPEVIKTSCWNDGNLQFVITKNSNTGMYQLYKYDTETAKVIKTGNKAKTPIDLERYMKQTKECC